MTNHVDNFDLRIHSWIGWKLWCKHGILWFGLFHHVFALYEWKRSNKRLWQIFSWAQKLPCIAMTIGGGFKHFLFSPLPGEMIQFDWYYSNGLKPPTRIGLTGSITLTLCFTMFTFTSWEGDPHDGSRCSKVWHLGKRISTMIVFHQWTSLSGKLTWLPGKSSVFFLRGNAPRFCACFMILPAMLDSLRVFSIHHVGFVKHMWMVGEYFRLQEEEHTDLMSGW